MNKLAGTLFVHNGERFDYCYLEAIKCLTEFCDYTIVVDAGSNDGTAEKLKELNYPNFKVIYLTNEEWEAQTGKEKLNYFTNVAIQEADRMGFQYQFNLQSDEIVHEKSYEVIRKAIQDNEDGYLCSRINLWGSPYKKLIVDQSRMPCSDKVIRLAKTNRRSVGDAESLGVVKLETKYADDIRIYHMGFVRDRKIMKDKVIHIQEKVFGVNHDPKLDGVDEFVPERWFSESDLQLIDEPLPLIIQDWAKKRS